jgi:hypothetical protein
MVRGGAVIFDKLEHDWSWSRTKMDRLCNTDSDSYKKVLYIFICQHIVNCYQNKSYRYFVFNQLRKKTLV